MAYRELQLPTLKVTRRPTSGGKVVEFVQLGQTTVESSHDCVVDPSKSCDSPIPERSHPDISTFLQSDGMHMMEPTGYELEEKSMVAGWENVRGAILRAVTESAAMPPQCVCVICNEAEALLQCVKCGPSGYFCCKCFELYHQKVNIFHVAEKWEVHKLSIAISNDLKGSFCRLIIMSLIHMPGAMLMFTHSIRVQQRRM